MRNTNELTLSEIQRASLEILIQLDSVCRGKNLVYTLTYGTLIGAIRHKGFIPWDDDIDILMPRKDYEELRRFFLTEYNGNLKWCDRTTVTNYPYCIARVSDMNYRYTTSVENEKLFDIGTFVDVYPLDNYCDTESQALKLGRKVWLKNRLFDIYLNPNKTKGILKKVIRNIISIILKLIYGNRWQFRVDNEIFDMIVKQTNDNNKIVGVISQVEWKELMKREWFTNYVNIQFENKNFLMCEGWHELLNSIYGDYMKLPEKDKRVPTHNYTITRRYN